MQNTKLLLQYHSTPKVLLQPVMLINRAHTQLIIDTPYLNIATPSNPPPPAKIVLLLLSLLSLSPYNIRTSIWSWRLSTLFTFQTAHQFQQQVIKSSKVIAKNPYHRINVLLLMIESSIHVSLYISLGKPYMKFYETLPTQLYFLTPPRNHEPNMEVIDSFSGVIFFI